MGRINSKVKGNSQELKISKILTEKLPPLNFKRVPSSGALLGGTNSSLANRFNEESANVVVGDIFCTNGKVRFVIESKSYKESVKFYELLKPNCQIYDWYCEAEFDCKKFENRLPLLVFKYNRTDDFVCIQNNLVRDRIPASKLITVGELSILKLSDFLELGVEFWKTN